MRFVALNYKIVPPKVVVEAINEYKKENDTISNFIENKCELNNSFKQPSGELFKSYKDYCLSVGEIDTKRVCDFNKMMNDLGYNHQRTNKGAFFSGLRLKCSYVSFKVTEDDTKNIEF